MGQAEDKTLIDHSWKPAEWIVRLSKYALYTSCALAIVLGFVFAASLLSFQYHLRNLALFMQRIGHMALHQPKL